MKIYGWTPQDGGVFTGSLSSITINPESQLELIGSEAFAGSK